MTARPLELVVGCGHSAAAPVTLAIRAVDLARAHGFTAIRLQVSRVPGSKSRFVLATCPRGERWKLRISNHRRPEDAEAPHLDLISRDGVAGTEQIDAFLRAIVAREVKWFDVSGSGRNVSALQRRRWGRR